MRGVSACWMHCEPQTSSFEPLFSRITLGSRAASNAIYAVGGYTSVDSTTPVATAEYLSLTHNTWSAAPNLLQAQSMPFAIYIAGERLVDVGWHTRRLVPSSG